MDLQLPPDGLQRITFVEAFPTAPTLFRYIVLEEETWTCELMIATKKMYLAVAMEWYQTAQGPSIEEAVESLELMLMGNAAIAMEHPDHSPRPSPEEYQRVATSGDRYVCFDPRWAELFGPEGLPIVGRGTLDMATSKMRLVRKVKP